MQREGSLNHFKFGTFVSHFLRDGMASTAVKRLKKWRCFVVVVQTGRGERDTVQAEGETAGEAAEVHGVPPLHVKEVEMFFVVVQTGRGERDTVQAEGETAGEAAEVHGVPPLHGEGAGGRGGVPRTARHHRSLGHAHRHTPGTSFLSCLCFSAQLSGTKLMAYVILPLSALLNLP